MFFFIFQDEDPEDAGGGCDQEDNDHDVDCDNSGNVDGDRIAEDLVESLDHVKLEPNVSDEPADVEVKDERTPQEIMDDLLDHALLQCLKTTYSAKKSEFPILTSNFFRLHMVPACPPDQALDVKKSSHKKLSKYLDSKDKLGLLKIKELSKGVESIVSVDYEHELIRGHRVVKYAKTEEETASSEAANAEAKYEPPVIQELFAVTANVLKLFKTADVCKGEILPSFCLIINLTRLICVGTGLTVQEVRKILTGYVKANDLKAEAGGFVKLDPLLGELVPGKADTVAWEELQQAVLAKMSPGYSLQFGDKPAQVTHFIPVNLLTGVVTAECDAGVQGEVGLHRAECGHEVRQQEGDPGE